MDVLTDTNIIIRGVHRQAAQHREALRALKELRNRGDRVCVVPQNLYEFWTVATRPIPVSNPPTSEKTVRRKDIEAPIGLRTGAVDSGRPR